MMSRFVNLLLMGLMVAACETAEGPAGPVSAPGVEVLMSKVTDAGVAEPIGVLVLADTAGGLSIRADLRGLPPGLRGFHVHQNGDCSPAMRDGKLVAALAAGGHYDADGSGKHEGPHGNGHKGDLPSLSVDGLGNAQLTLIASRLSLKDVRGRSIIVHEGGDNYSDQPKPLGGGGARIACGVVSPVGN